MRFWKEGALEPPRATLLLTASLSLIAGLAAGVGIAALPLKASAAEEVTDPAADPDWSWPDSADAVAAAPDSHIVLLENDRVRVLRVVIEPGDREPMHTHRWPSVMIVDQPARIRYYDAQGELRFESREGPRPTSDPEPDWLRPEGLHAVENVDTRPFRAYRIELKP